MPEICEFCGGVCSPGSHNAKVDAHLETMVEPVAHQKLINGLSRHVLRKEMEPIIAQTILEYYTENHPGNDDMDEAVLWTIRKEWGLSTP